MRVISAGEYAVVTSANSCAIPIRRYFALASGLKFMSSTGRAGSIATTRSAIAPQVLGRGRVAAARAARGRGSVPCPWSAAASRLRLSRMSVVRDAGGDAVRLGIRDLDVDDEQVDHGQERLDRGPRRVERGLERRRQAPALERGGRLAHERRPGRAARRRRTSRRRRTPRGRSRRGPTSSTTSVGA